MDELSRSLTYLGDAKEPLLQSLSLPIDEKIAILDESKLSRAQLLSRFPFLRQDPLIGNGFVFPSSAHLGKTLSYFAGAISIQDPSSALPVHFLDVKPGELVLDCCAAPGGKAIQAALAGPALVLANDLSYPRSLELSSNLERMGLANVEVISKNLTAYATDLAETFDKIILDAPCSGQAMFRKNALARSDWSPNKVQACAAIQKELLEGAATMLRKGGRMVYSTCSFTYEEDVGMILDFLSRHPDFTPVPLQDDPRFFHLPALKEAIYLLPCFYPGEGQFLCLLEKQGEGRPRFPKSRGEMRFSRQLAPYGLCGCSAEQFGGCVYALPVPGFRFASGIIKYGLQALSLPRYEPCHNLRALLPGFELSQEEALAYLSGAQLARVAPSGFLSLRYANLPLGLGKAVQGQIKNRLPKGLRRKFEPADLI